MKFITKNTLNPILFSEFICNISYGHYNIITINDYKDIKNKIYEIPLVINNKYNSEFLNIIYCNNFSFNIDLYKTNINKNDLDNNNYKLKGKLNDLFNKENNKFIITKQYKF
jgi:hypothetical protein